ncbi:integrase, catalytic region, zinc finger, CCHC-type containing protein [Tanacetum coccineum]
MLAPKCATYNGRSTFANPKYLKKAQSDKPCLYEISYDTSDPAKQHFCPDGKKTLTLKGELYKLYLFIVDSGCTKPCTGNLQLLCNFVEKFSGYCSFVEMISLLHIIGYGGLLQGCLDHREIYMFCESSSGNYLLTGSFSRGLISTQTSLQDINFINSNLLPKLKYVKDQLYRGTNSGTRYYLFISQEEGIENKTSTPRTPEQNGVVERRNRTLVEAARTMLSASKLPLSFWAEAVATACYTQNRSFSIMERRHITS